VSVERISINTTALQEHAGNVQGIVTLISDISKSSFALEQNQGEVTELTKSFEEELDAITALSRELLNGYINVVQAAHGEYVGSETALAAQFKEIG